MDPKRRQFQPKYGWVLAPGDKLQQWEVYWEFKVAQLTVSSHILGLQSNIQTKYGTKKKTVKAFCFLKRAFMLWELCHEFFLI